MSTRARDSVRRPTAPVPTSGTIRIRPRYCECDPMGVVHHAAYLPWLEMGRTELLRASGVSYRSLEEDGVYLVMVRIDCRYRRAARYDDDLEVRTRVVGPGSRVKIRHEYSIVRHTDAPADPEEILTASSVIACVDRQGRPAALPDWLAGEP